MAQPRSPLHQPVLRALRAQLGGDPLAHPAPACHNPDVRKEKRLVLDRETAPQLGVVHHRAVPRHQVLSARPGEVRLTALEQVLGVCLEHRGSGGEGELDECRLAARPHRRQQPVHGWIGAAGELVERLRPLDERTVLLEAQHRGRRVELALERPQAAVWIGGLQGSLHHPLVSRRAGERKPGRARGLGVVDLESERRLPQEQPAPPTAQQALVERRKHRSHFLSARVIVAVHLDLHACVAPAPAREQARERHRQRARRRERSQRPRVCAGGCAH